MRGIKHSVLLLVLAIFVLSACIFKPQPFKGVISYRDGKVFIRHNKYYTVGMLPEGWRGLKTRARTISFYNEALRASISTDAYCGKSVTDRTLASLSGDIITALEKRQVTDERNFELDERGALRQHVTGSVDGVPTDVDLVIVRKNYCVFDFYSVSPAGGNPVVRQAFDAFVNGFHYE